MDEQFPQWLMATSGVYFRGNPTTKYEPTLCWIDSRSGEFYIGHWFGESDAVAFPVSATRELSRAERQHYHAVISGKLRSTVPA